MLGMHTFKGKCDLFFFVCVILVSVYLCGLVDS